MQILFVRCLMAQGWLVEENNIETNWNATAQIGQSALMNEVANNFSVISNDMNHQSNWAFNVQMSKMVFERLDFGSEFGYSSYRGYNKRPSNIYYLMQHARFNDGLKKFAPYEISYSTKVPSFSLFMKYNFINFSSFSKGYFSINIYTRFGLGVSLINTQLGYRDKPNYMFTKQDNPLFVSNGIGTIRPYVYAGLGVNYQLSERIFFSIESNFQAVGSDIMDGLYYYDSALTAEMGNAEALQHYVKMFGLGGKIMAGITYFFNFDTGKGSRLNALPWYMNRYRSYYSRYQNPTTKKSRQLRLPFYNDQFKE